jgi:peroxiredoxin
MAKRLALLAAASLVVAAAAAVPASASGMNLDGRPAPEIRLMGGLNGASAATTLASLRGRVVCLKFWLTRCPVCRGTLPEFQRIHDRYGKSGVTCLSVVLDRPEGVAPYLREAGWTFPVGCDPDGSGSSSLYGVQHFPGDYVIGVDGIVRASTGYPENVIAEELRKFRVMEWGDVPEALRAARDAIEDGDYGEGLRQAEAAAKAPDASAAVRTAVAKLVEIARRRQDNRFARVDSLVAAGNAPAARAELQKIVADFRGTSLEERAQKKLESVGR